MMLSRYGYIALSLAVIGCPVVRCGATEANVNSVEYSLLRSLSYRADSVGRPFPSQQSMVDLLAQRRFTYISRHGGQVSNGQPVAY